jgi:hypothetical protein
VHGEERHHVAQKHAKKYLELFIKTAIDVFELKNEILDNKIKI